MAALLLHGILVGFSAWWYALVGYRVSGLNATDADAPNILMDGTAKHSGITHIALLCPDLEAAKAALAAAGIPLSGGPIQFGPKARGMFVRDPDRNVIELHQRLG